MRAAAKVGQALAEQASGACFIELDEAGAATAEAATRQQLDLGDGDDAWAALSQRLHPAHRGPFLQALAAHRGAPAKHGLRLEVALAHASGWRWFEVRAASRPSPEGPARRTTLGFRDVSPLKAALARAEAAEARTETLERELSRARSTPPPSPPVRRPPPARVEDPERGVREQRMSTVAACLDRARRSLERLQLPDPESLESCVNENLRLAQAFGGGRKQDPASVRNALRGVESVLEDLALVSLNAQLEALRLGASGAGLAAVAGQMKGLAKATTSAANELGNTVDAELAHYEQLRKRQQRLVATLEGSVEQVEALELAHSKEALRELRAALAEAQALLSS